ncbi:hypothetical protein I4U23_015338 [Adineta vaga]|nr:hypothetical protein I4U23_015338 [Adineta vaga]
MDLSSISYNINLYLLPIITISGIIGNVLNLFIFLRPALHRSCSVYFLAASINGLVILTFGTFVQWLTILFPILNGTRTSLEYCRFRTFVLYVIYNLAPYFTACITIDRFFSSSINANIRRLSSHVRIAYIVIPVVIFITSMAYIHMTFRYTLIGTSCRPEPGFYTDFFPFFTAAYYFFAIFIVILFGLGTSYNIRARNRRVQPIMTTTTTITMATTERRRTRGDTQLLFMLFVHILCYAFLALPYHLVLIIAAIRPTLTANTIFRFVQQMTYITLNLSQAINFYIFTLTASMYRKELLNLLHRVNLRCWK